jgi:hypothetical protein
MQVGDGEFPPLVAVVGLLCVQQLDHQVVGAGKQPVAILRFAGDQHEFPAAVGVVRLRAGERGFDHRPLVVVQRFRGAQHRDHAGDAAAMFKQPPG